jgi:hypothetical protein
MALVVALVVVPVQPQVAAQLHLVVLATLPLRLHHKETMVLVVLVLRIFLVVVEVAQVQQLQQQT